MASAIPNKNTALAADQKVIQGVKKHLAKSKTIAFAGTSYTPAELTALFQDDIDATDALDEVRPPYTEQVATSRAARAKAREVRLALKAYLLGVHGAKAVKMLGDFGFSAPKASGPKTVATKADAIVKAKATREARHTMGSRQKQLIKGDVSTPAPAEAPPRRRPPPRPAPRRRTPRVTA